MKKIFDFLKENPIIVKWTIWYFFIIWAILKYIFRFDALSAHYWWKFFHATLHGFPGFVFGFLMYSAIPIYIATTIITYRTKELIIPIPFEKTISEFLSKLFSKKTENESVEQKPVEEKEEIINEIVEPEYPNDLPAELRVPFARAKNRMPLNSAVSVYNQINTTPKITEPVPAPATMGDNTDIPIPTDFDISDNFENTMNDSVPMFRDINFDETIDTEEPDTELKNNTTKYLSEKNIEFETYHDFIATEKFVIYEHNDEDFWIMDGDSWFASGKQKDSPINELKELATQNDLTPVLYLHSQNIMDIDNIIKNFTDDGIRVIKNLDEL